MTSNAIHRADPKRFVERGAFSPGYDFSERSRLRDWRTQRAAWGNDVGLRLIISFPVRIQDIW
jgi:hypothetical protein